MLGNLLPKEEKFYRFLLELSAQGLESARQFKSFIKSRDAAGRKTASAKMISCKAEAKKTLANVTRELCLTFVTPFDREDIQNLASELYKIPKTIDKAREYLELHNVEHIDELSEQIGVILREAEGMESMVQALIQGGKIKHVLEQATLLDDLENKGDAILSDLLFKLLRDTSDVKQLILRKDIYDLLERVIDRYRDAAGIALQIALKHS